ncbi:MAG: hypothetical protein JNM57_13365 [Cyclobacteriaceae bacterium]|nr:hypothetical protein [Cyclobacteriaceae bacterium]
MTAYLEKVKEFKHATVSIARNDSNTLVVAATASYIPIDQFKLIFSHIGDYVKNEKVTKLIFDKRNLSVFHQPSMEWYFVEWKEKMFELGLVNHVKILPKDEVFRQSVKIGRNKINETYPDGKFHRMNIRYAESLEEALSL